MKEEYGAQRDMSELTSHDKQILTEFSTNFIQFLGNIEDIAYTIIEIGYSLNQLRDIQKIFIKSKCNESYPRYFEGIKKAIKILEK